MEINKLLDECMVKTGAKTDYQLGQKTGIPRARISDYRAGSRIPDNYACFKIAEILEMEEKQLIAHFESISAKNVLVKDYWEKKLKQLGGIAASIFFAVIFNMTSTQSEAATASVAPHQHCILC